MSGQYRDPFDDRLPCATCGGTGYLEPFPTTGKFAFGSQLCRDCMGSGRCPAEHPLYELDDEYEVDDNGQFRRIREP